MPVFRIGTNTFMHQRRQGRVTGAQPNTVGVGGGPGEQNWRIRDAPRTKPSRLLFVEEVAAAPQTISLEGAGSEHGGADLAAVNVGACEPLNTGGGVAARNGTNTHTIPFGFTSASGSLLVFVVAGAVTHTESGSGGWTERLSPVSSAELSVFTKTSTGDSSITLTHNASDYPVAWYVFEWPAGMTWVDGVQETANDATFPTLSGLPGTSVELGAAYAIAAPGTSGSVASTWTAGAEGWGELLDSLTLSDGATDGIYLTVASAAAFTGTSTTPTGTFPRNTPPVTPADAQKVVWALQCGAAALTITLEVAATEHAAADVVLTGSGAATISLEAAGSDHGASDVVVVGSGAVTISLEGAGSEHGATDLDVEPGAATISLEAAGSDHGGTDLTLTGSGAATISLEAAGSEHAGADLVVVGDGAATISLEGAGSDHAGADVTVVGAGAATISLEATATEHGALDLDISSQAPNAIQLDGADSLHAAADVVLTGSGAATISLEGAGSDHAAADLDVEPGGAATISLEPAATDHAGNDVVLVGSGVAVIVLEAAASQHGANDLLVTQAIPTPGENIDRVRACEGSRVATCDDHRVEAVDSHRVRAQAR